jgi:hypothetical protein
VAWSSGFYDGEEETRRDAPHDRTRARRRDVSRSPEELVPEFGQIEIEDLETGERLIDGAEVAASYHSAFNDFPTPSPQLRDGVDYALISTGRPPESALRDYLLRRGRQRRARRTAIGGR